MMKTDTKTKKYELVIATEDDSDAIKNLFESVNYGGPIDLQFRRGDQPYKSFLEEEAGAVVVLMKDNEAGKAIGMGACSFHDIYLNGEIKRGGYLNGLKILSEYRLRLRSLPDAFKLMNDATKAQVDIYYATILQQALDVQRSFEKPRRSMPLYTKQSLYTSFLFGASANTGGLALEKGNVEGLDCFYETRLCQYNLAPLNKNMRGVCDDDFITWRENGKILASCAIFNNQSRKNYYINGYKGVVNIIPYLPTRLIGLPSFPKTGNTVNNASMSMLMFDEDVDGASRARFIRAASSFAKGYDGIALGLCDNDSTYHACKSIIHLKYSAYVYTINYGEVQNVNERPTFLDIAYM